jgi:spectinomycin phosphotransferase
LLSQPSDFDVAQLSATLHHHWGLDLASLAYLPLGFGSHHWAATETTGNRWFVTVDDLRTGRLGGDPDAAFAAFAASYRTATSLRNAGLEFVLAPIVDRDGEVIRRLGPSFSVILLPFVEGESADFGVYRNERDRNDVLRHLGRLHDAAVPPELTRREDFAVPKRAELVETLGDLDVPWATGPFAEPARQLLMTTADNLRTALERYDALVAEVSASTSAWVVTHGEPHAGNVIRDGQDRLLLFDWDTVAIGPRERDLWMVVDDDPSVLAAYSETGGVAEYSAQAISLYRLWWELADNAEYVSVFRRPHDRDANNEASWRHLSRGLPIRAELLG